MHFEFKVVVDVERDEGKFASREDLSTQIQESIESADPGSIEGENGGQFSTVTWDVEEVES